MRRSTHALLSYLPSINRFVDTNGCIIHDLTRIFDIWQLNRWKREKETSIIMDKDGKLWRLEYRNDDEEDDVFDFIGWNESYGAQMVRSEY